MSTGPAKIPTRKPSQLQPAKLTIWCSKPEGHETACSVPTVGMNTITIITATVSLGSIGKRQTSDDRSGAGGRHGEARTRKRNQ